MNIRMKIATGVLAGLIAATALVGTAVAAPRLVAAPTGYAFGMMRSIDASGTFGSPAFAGMLAFMNGYRSANGSIDFGRMRSDVNSGKVTPPCLGGRGVSRGATSTPPAQTPPVQSYGMMRRSTPSAGYGYGPGMMGGTY